MKSRIFAWSIVLFVCYGVYVWGMGFKNPWSVAPHSAVIDALPPAVAGCGAHCE